jgi:hypothetical protein
VNLSNEKPGFKPCFFKRVNLYRYAACAAFAATALAPTNSWTRRAAALRVVASLARRTADVATSAFTQSDAATWLGALVPLVVACAEDPKVGGSAQVLT